MRHAYKGIFFCLFRPEKKIIKDEFKIFKNKTGNGRRDKARGSNEIK
jgi:hypothetical protein